MPRQQIIWTALPNGLRQPGSLTTLKLSVFVSPRLTLDDETALGALGTFPDFLDWPARMQSGQISFKIVVDDNVAGAMNARIVTSPAPESALWRALFDMRTPVRSHKFETISEPLTSYPANGTAAGIAEGYTKIGWNSPYRPASKDVVSSAFPSLAAAMQRDATVRAPALARARDAAAFGADALERAHREIGENLLRNDQDASFADKLEAAMSIAGELARSAPSHEAVPIVPATADEASPFIQFAAFHERLREARVDVARSEMAPRDADIIDFHQTLSALGEFPMLLRRLGMVIDLEFDATDALRSSIGALKQLRVDVTLTPARPSESYTPVTRYILDDRTVGNPLPFPLFAAAPRRAAELAPSGPIQEPDFEIVGGLLNLGIAKPDAPREQQFDIVRIDIDGAGKKILNAIKEIVADAAHPGQPIDTAAMSAAPALRASGLSLVRAGQTRALKEGEARAGEHEAALRAGRPAELFAEDLVRGYRIDVRTAPAGVPTTDTLPWLSLHGRLASFAIKRPGTADLTLAGIEDEGFVQPSFVQEPAAGRATNPVYVNESFCLWRGWSLSAPPPANPIDLSPEQPANPIASPLPRVDTTIEPAPRSLPRLRYGNSYQLRARTVDLAGNSLTVEGANEILRDLRFNGRPEPYIPIIRDELPYRRYDPVPAPVLVPCEEMTEGEALDILVVRSNGPGTTTASYAADLGGGRYKGVNERHIVPAKTSQSAAETHGALDAAFGQGGDPARVFNICRRGGGTLNDDFVTNLATGAQELLPDFADPVTGTRIQNGLRFVRIEQPEPLPGTQDAGYTVHYERHLRLPYLPDPLSRGAALFGLPGSDGKSLVLTPGASPGTPAELKTVTPQLLPQQALDALGYVTKIDFGPADGWPEMSPFLLQLDGAQAGPPAEPKWSEPAGARTLTVHLAPGETKDVWLSSFPDLQDVALFGLHFWWGRVGAPEGDRTFLNMAQHGALAMLTPAHKLTLVHAVQQPIIPPTPDGMPFGFDKFDGGTLVYFRGGFHIHGLSTAKLDLFAAWTEPDETGGEPRTLATHVFEFPIHRDVGPPPPPGDPVPVAKYIQGTERVELYSPPSEAEANRRRWLARHEFNDTRHRVVTYRLVATTRFREFFPDRITSDIKKITRETEFARMIVPNSAVPPVPEISHIVPSFGWEVNAGLTLSKRIGGGLRVYLGPTWYATGEEEKLAIVGAPQSGADPIHIAPDGGALVTITPTVQSVTVPGQSAKIYPFPVHFDKISGNWYCDLTFDTAGNYFPFVKLVLARYQEQSLVGMHLSPPVEAGMYQLAPDRIAELEYFDFVDQHPGMRKITVKVTGAKALAAQLAAAEHSVTYGFEVTLEERQKIFTTDNRDDQLGWTTAIAPDQPVADPLPIGSPVLWQGQLLVAQNAPKEQRIVIREYEFYASNAVPPDQGWIGQTADAPSRRLIYADVIPLI